MTMRFRTSLAALAVASLAAFGGAALAEGYKSDAQTQMNSGAAAMPECPLGSTDPACIGRSGDAADRLGETQRLDTDTSEEFLGISPGDNGVSPSDPCFGESGEVRRNDPNCALHQQGLQAPPPYEGGR